MRLNADLGESYGDWRMGNDAQVMPHIHLSNIACGFHAGDPLTMQGTLALAKQHQVAVGAHPAYPDLAGFGRRSMRLSKAQIIADLHYQVAALEGMAAAQGMTLNHIKPHGALYNDMMREAAVRAAIFEAVASYGSNLPLIVQATPDAQTLRDEAEQHSISLLFEAFADRRYQDNGLLVPRGEAGAVLDSKAMLTQVDQLMRHGQVTTAGGQTLDLDVDTLCVHGDNDEGVANITAIRERVDKG